MKNFLPYLIAAFLIISLLGNIALDDPRDIPVINEPKQYNLSQAQINKLKYTKELGDWKILIIPLAHYEISAKVLNTKEYYYGLDAVIAPQDIGVAWGFFKDGDEYRKIKTSYTTRMLHFSIDSREYSKNYLVEHVANIHIIPKNKEILKKIRKVRKGDDLYLKGYLVRVEGLNMKTREKYTRATSLSRRDSGNGACESMYVTDVIFHHMKKK